MGRGMRKLVLILVVMSAANAYAVGGTVGNGGDSIAIQFKDIGNTLVAQLRFAEKKNKLPIDPESFKQVVNKSIVESTNNKLVLKGKRKDAINYPSSQRIVIYAPGWRQLSIQDKRKLVLHEYLGLLKVDDSQYQISSALETVASVETVPYFAGKDEDCLDENHHAKAGEIYDARLINVIVISDVYSETDRETYCTVSVETPDKVQRKFSASFSQKCRELFTQKAIHRKLRVVRDHICEILN